MPKVIHPTDIVHEFGGKKVWSYNEHNKKTKRL